MPFALVLIGLMLIATGVQDTYVAMGAQLKKDFVGPKSFTMWAVAMIMLGMLGDIEQLRRLSWLFMFLVVLALFLSEGTDFLGKLQSAISKGPISPPRPVQSSGNGISDPKLSKTVDNFNNAFGTGVFGRYAGQLIEYGKTLLPVY